MEMLILLGIFTISIAFLLKTPLLRFVYALVIGFYFFCQFISYYIWKIPANEVFLMHITFDSVKIILDSYLLHTAILIVCYALFVGFIFYIPAILQRISINHKKKTAALAVLIAAVCAFIMATHTKSIFYASYTVINLYNAKGNVEKSPFWHDEYDSSQKQDYLIAHAGGAIDGRIYTNSLEAVLQSIENGYRFIELDLLVTTDGKIVARHNWGRNNIQRVSLDELMNQKIYDKYTPVSYKEINKIMIENEHIILVTDRITDYELLKEQIYFPDRMIVEVFSLEQYENALKAGFKHPALCIWDYANPQYLIDNNISIVTSGLGLIRKYPRTAQIIHDSGVTIIPFTSNDIGFIENNIGIAASMFYTDHVLPDYPER